jgi:lysozyme-like protein
MKPGEALVFLLLLAFSAPQKRMLTLGQLRALAVSVGFPNPDLAAAIAMAESGGNILALGDIMLGHSYGLWQINARAHPEYDVAQLVDPTYNAKAALEISHRGTNWQPWTTFKSGAYKKYMPPGASV